LKSDSPGDFDLRHPFKRKGGVEDLDGQWPLTNHSGWGALKTMEDCYDIWATMGDTEGEINLYAADGTRIVGYVHNHQASGDHLTQVWSTEAVDGYKVGAVRVVHGPKPLAEKKDQEVLKGLEWAHYALCEVSLAGKGPFAIQAFFHHPQTKGIILPPHMDQASDSLNIPVGMAVDSVRLWVFGTWFIACATHADVKRCVESGGTTPPWSIYQMPADVGGYDPKAKAPLGLRDLAACDDETLTAIFQDKDGNRRIITATTRFAPGKPIILEGGKTDPRGNVTPTHGWVMDKSVYAYRVHKQPIFCWSVIEKLAGMLKMTA
jgi:hypothetical protein